MTTILTFSCNAFILQVSDRLISAESGGIRKKFDELSNKAIVYRARNAIVSIGYGGPAYLQGMPTDEWIAERLFGEPLPRARDDRPCMRTGRSRSFWPDFGWAIRQLRMELESVPPDTVGLTIICAGWQCVRSRARPIIVELKRHPNSSSVQINEAPRWLPRSDFVLHEIGGYLDPQGSNSVMQRLKSADSPDAIEDIFVETIRQIATTNPTSVGQDLLSTFIPPLKYGPPVIRFLPQQQHQIGIQTGAGMTVIPTYYSPWLIGPGMIVPASVNAGSGDSTVGLGGLNVVICGGPPTESPIISFMSGQKRPPHP
jgi:hypothetical protein